MAEQEITRMNESGGGPEFPAGLHNAYWFAAFNPLSYQIILGGPMILYAKTLGASATVIGVIAGMMPLLVIFQIPAASHINRIGYRKFVLAGWSMRVLFIFGMAVVPLTGVFLNAGNRLALLLALLFCFNLSRGISSCAWLPWISQLVPAELRGRYLARDAATQNIASFVTFLLAAAVLSGETRPWRFSVIFTLSAVMGAASLVFLRRIPDVEIRERSPKSKQPVPWLEIGRYGPFRKLLRAVVAWSIAYGGVTAFSITYLKVKGGMDEGEILLVTSIAFIGGVSSLWFLGHALDRLGSKPVLNFCCAAWAAVLVGWMTLAGEVFEPRLAFVLTLQFLMGLLAALSNMGYNRLAMAVVPAMGRNHFFALYSVLSNLALGLAPILWGLLMDAVGQHQPALLGIVWNRYTVFFGLAGLAFLTALVWVRGLEEPQAASMEELLREILIESPQRFWLRFWPRG